MERMPLWFKLSLLYLAISVILLGVGFLPFFRSEYFLPGFVMAYTGGVMSAPGIFIIYVLFHPGPIRPDQFPLFYSIGLFLTWFLVIVPFCWILSKFKQKLTVTWTN